MIRFLLAGALGAAWATTALAHVTLENQEAKAGASYKATFRVPAQGCEGTATTAIRVKIPDGVIGVKPMPKPGWTLATTVSKYPKAYDLYHRKVNEGVTEIVWSGGKLPDDWYDEFTFQGFLAGDLRHRQAGLLPGGAGVRERRAPLDEIPGRRKTSSDYKEPAPALKLVPGTGHRRLMPRAFRRVRRSSRSLSRSSPRRSSGPTRWRIATSIGSEPAVAATGYRVRLWR